MWKFLSVLNLLLVILSFLAPLHAQSLLLEGTDTDTLTIRWSPLQAPLQFDKHHFLEIGYNEPHVKYKFGSFHFKKTKWKPHYKVSDIDSIQQTPDKIKIYGHFSEIDCQYQFEIQKTDSFQIHISIHLSESTFNRIKWTYYSNPEAHFYGFGEQFSHFDMQGKKPVIFSEESGIGRGDKRITKWSKLVGAAGNEYTTHITNPLFLNIQPDRAWQTAFLGHNRAYTCFDFSKNTQISVEIWDNHLDADLWAHNSTTSLISLYTKTLGRMPELPDWAYGTWLGLQGGWDAVLPITKTAKNAGNPVTAIWIQDWVGKRKTRVGSQLWWRWTPDTITYPNFKQTCTKLLEEDSIRVLGYINPFLSGEGPLFELAKKENYLVKNTEGQPYAVPTAGFPAYMIDLTNPEACEWLKSIIKKQLIDNGLSGWMADYAEGLPWDAQLFSGVDAAIFHNEYPVVFARLNREAIEEAGRMGEIVFFNRSGHNQTSQYSTSIWMGDQLVSWGKNDGLPSTIPGALSAGLSGYPLVHSDIGGYTTVTYPFVKKFKRSRELLYRWTELNTFFPVFRTHEGLKPEKNHQIYQDSSTIAFFSRMGQLHAALAPYFKSLVWEATQTGIPIIRPLFLEYPQDPETYKLMYQFLVGRDLLVAPTIKKKAMGTTVYIPEGLWQSVWDETVIEGPKTLFIDTPFGKPATFIRKNSPNEQLLLDIFKSFRE